MHFTVTLAVGRYIEGRFRGTTVRYSYLVNSDGSFALTLVRDTSFG